MKALSIAVSVGSVVFAGIAFLISWHGFTSTQVDMLDPVFVALPFGIAWCVCVYTAHRMYGRRALWLLLGLPFAWFYAVMLALFVIGHALHGGGV